MLIDKNSILTKLQAEYNVGPRFLKLYLETWFGSSSVPPKKFNTIYENPTANLWFFFGISANSRGRDVAQTLKPYISIYARKYLDVGCGYGGFLIAFSELDLDVFGIDLDPKLITYSKANLKDHNLSEDKAQVGSILDPTLISRIGKFDVITCNDVLEHVKNAPLAMTNMVEMLTPIGTMLIQVPNKDFIDFVRKDGHYNLFGITLLKDKLAEDYHNFFYTEEYSMGEYYELDYYINNLSYLKCDTIYLSPKFSKKNFKQTALSIIKSAQEFLIFLTQKGKPSLLIKLVVTIKYIQYIAQLFFHGLLALFSREKRLSFHKRYLTDFWLIVATKK